MKRECPVTGEPARVSQAADLVTVEHPKLGRFVLHSNGSAPSGDRRRGQGANGPLDQRIAVIGTRTAEPHRRARSTSFSDLQTWRRRFPNGTSLGRPWREADEERLWMKLPAGMELQQQPHRGQHSHLPRDRVAAHPWPYGRRPPHAGLRGNEGARCRHRPYPVPRRRGAGHRGARCTGLNQDAPQGALLAERGDSRTASQPASASYRAKYKTQPNHVRTATGELHRFAEPEETPALMEEWTRDFRRDLERTAYPLPLHPSRVALELSAHPSLRRRQRTHGSAAHQLRSAAEGPAAHRDQERRPRPLYRCAA